MMLVDEFMINYRFATKRKNKSRLSRQIPQVANAQIPTHDQSPTTTPWNNNARVTKAEEVLTAKCKEKEEGNNKVVISYTYHTLSSIEVLYKTLTWP